MTTKTTSKSADGRWLTTAECGLEIAKIMSINHAATSQQIALTRTASELKMTKKRASKSRRRVVDAKTMSCTSTWRLGNDAGRVEH